MFLHNLQPAVNYRRLEVGRGRMGTVCVCVCTGRDHTSYTQYTLHTHQCYIYTCTCTLASVLTEMTHTESCDNPTPIYQGSPLIYLYRLSLNSPVYIDSEALSV